jgi:hypothetical protein
LKSETVVLGTSDKGCSTYVAVLLQCKMCSPIDLEISLLVCLAQEFTQYAGMNRKLFRLSPKNKLGTNFKIVEHV